MQQFIYGSKIVIIVYCMWLRVIYQWFSTVHSATRIGAHKRLIREGYRTGKRKNGS